MRYGLTGHQGNGSHRARRLVLAALLAFACVLALAPRAHGASNMEVAVQDDPLFVGNGYFGRTKGLAQARQMGATRIRVNLAWTSVMSARQARQKKAPRNPKYDFSLYDGLVGATQGGNVRVQLALVGPAPAWATGNKKVGPYKVKAKYFGDFARAVAQHYNGLVDRYSIWNEPNYVGWLAPLRSAPKLYRAMYVQGYQAIRAAAPNAQVLVAETSPYAIPRRATAPLTFLRAMTCSNKSFSSSRCGGLKADGYAHHPYDFDHPPTYKYPGADNATINTLGRLTSALDRLARSGGLSSPSGAPLDLYLTEYGYFRSGKRRVAESRRAKYVVQAFQIAQRNPRVREMLQYLLAQPAHKYRFFDTSILSNRGKATKTFKALVKWAKSAMASGAIARDPVVAGGGGGGGQPPYTDPNAGSSSGSGSTTPAPTTSPGTGGTTPPPTGDGSGSGGGTPCTVTVPVPLPPGCTP
jgi:hypothetical protein